MAMDESKHILSEFDEALEGLRANVLMMASLTERNLGHARAAAVSRDEDRANTAIVDDEEVDILEGQVEDEGMLLLTRFQPVAGDLRVVIGTMKVSVNLERISDQAVNIARRAKRLLTIAPLPQAPELEAPFAETIRLVHEAITAFADRDLMNAAGLKSRSRTVIQGTQDFAAMLTEHMAFAVAEQIQAFLDLLYVARYLEPIAAFAANIGEDTVLAFSKADVREPVAE
jgi:phosphate transport system protein